MTESQMFRMILELIGTVAFAVSGAAVGMHKKMDLLGVATLGVITAVGGGVFRDLLIGQVPPKTFSDPVYIPVAIVTSLIVFIPAIGRRIDLDRFGWVFADAIGLGAFTVVGMSAGLPFENTFFAVFLGVVTGVGGGVIRDICAGEIPMIFVRHFYACACIIGAVVCAVVYPYSADIAFLSGFVCVVLLRLFAARFKWHLPKAK